MDDHRNAKTEVTLASIQEAEHALYRAMTLNEQLARAEGERKRLEREAKAVNMKLETTRAWVDDTKRDKDFMAVVDIG